MLTRETIEKMVQKERGIRTLCALPENFFESAKTYLLRKEKVAKGKDDTWEMEWAKRTIQDLLDIREGKIMAQAIINVKAGIQPENITHVEKEFYNSIISNILEFHKRQNSMLEAEEEKLATIAMLEDVQEFVCVNMQSAGPFKKGDVANIPELNAKLLVKKGAAKIVNVMEEKQSEEKAQGPLKPI